MNEFWEGFWVGVAFISASAVIIGMLLGKDMMVCPDGDEHENEVIG